MFSKMLKGRRRKVSSFNGEPLTVLDNKMSREYAITITGKKFKGNYRKEIFYLHWLLYRCFIFESKKKKGPKKINRYDYLYNLEEKYNHYKSHTNFKDFLG